MAKTLDLSGIINKKLPVDTTPINGSVTPALPKDESRKALSVKLRLSDYRRLRLHAAATDRNHQDICEQAILMYLDQFSDNKG